MNNDTYKNVTTIQFPGMVARIYRPELTPEERTRRMQAIQKAAAALLTERK